MMNCREATKLLSDAQEQALPLTERAALQMHVMLCSGCDHFKQQMDSLRAMMRAYAKGEGEDEDDGKEQ